MDEGDSKDNKQIKKQKYESADVQRYSVNAGTILQSLWIRYRTIFPTATDRQFMESELRFVLYSGFIFWGIHLLYQLFK
jgi:murein tripeptide amidase MpaA